MKFLLAAAVLAGCGVAPASASAQSPLDGTWKLDVSTAQAPTKPDVMLLQDGYFACKTCEPPYRVKADGAPQPLANDPYHDHVMIKVISAHELQQAFYKGGRKVAEGTGVVSPDGKTMTLSFTDSSNTSSAPVTGKVVEMRVAPGPAGSSPISGSWRTQTIAAMSENELHITYKVNGDTLSMSEPTGQSYTAKLDGTEAPFKGDRGVTSVSVKKTGARTFVETDKRGAKVLSVNTMTVAADGKSAKFLNEDKLAGTTSSIIGRKE